VKLLKTLGVAGTATLVIFAAACGEKKTATSPTPAAPTVQAPALEAPSADTQLDTLRPTLSVRNASSDQAGTRTYEFQVSDSDSFATANASNVAGYISSVTATGIGEGSAVTTWTPSQDLQPTTVFYWRARATQGTTVSAWSATGTFKSKLVGFNRPGEVYDPLIHGETVGEIVGSTTFIPGKGIQLNNGTSHVRYRLAQTIPGGEFSMDVEGLRANASGDKAKVFGMSDGQGDFITNDYRVDIQYRGTTGAPPNAIQWRVIYGDADDLDVRYEPDTAKRFASVFLLNPSTTYHWNFTWGSNIRLVMKDGGVNGNTLYDFGMAAPRGRYDPPQHYAYLGAPIGRSGNESASIAGTIYRNVWIANRPRPQSLGNAITNR
jgi:hypothetical protein